MKMATKQEIIRKYLAAYLKGSKREKSRILNLLEDVTGYERKALIRRFGTLQRRMKDQRSAGVGNGRMARMLPQRSRSFGNMAIASVPSACSRCCQNTSAC